MEREANYVAVGAFIVLVVAMAVGFVFWYSEARDSRDYNLYEIYFAGSVSGATRRAAHSLGAHAIVMRGGKPRAGA